MANRLKNVVELFSDLKARTIIIVTIMIIVFGLLIGFFKYKNALTGPTASSQLDPIPTGIKSIPGQQQQNIEYAKLQQKENQEKVQRAFRQGTSAIPTIIETTANQAPSSGTTALPENIHALALAAVKQSGCSVEALQNAKRAGVTASEIKQLGCSAEQLKAAGYSASDLLKAGFTLDDLKRLGYGLDALRNAGVCTCDLKHAGYTAVQLKQAGFTAANLKCACFTDDELAQAGFPPGASLSSMAAGCDPSALAKAREQGESPIELRRMGCNASQLQQLGLSASELKQAGYSAEELKAAGFSAGELLAAGYTPQQLKQAGFSAQDLRNAGLTARELKDAGFNGTDLRAAGFSAGELLAAGYNPQQLKEAGFSAQDLRNAGLTAKELKAAGFSPQELRAAGFTPGELRRAGFTPEELKAAGIVTKPGVAIYDCSIASLAKAKAAGVSAADIRENSGCDATELKAAGYSLADLKQAGFTAGELKRAGYSIAELKRAGLSALELRNAGFSPDELKRVGYSAAELKQAGYNGGELKRAGFSAADLKAAGFSSLELKNAGFSPQELKAAGFSAAELKSAGFSVGALKQAGFSVAALKDAGFNAGELKRAGFNIQQLKQAGFNGKELTDAGFTLTDLKNAGFSATELKQAGFNAKQLREAGFNARAIQEAGFSEAELQGAGFTPTELSQAGVMPGLELSDGSLTARGAANLASAQNLAQGGDQIAVLAAQQRQQYDEQQLKQNLQDVQSNMQGQAQQLFGKWTAVNNQALVVGVTDKEVADQAQARMASGRQAVSGRDGALSSANIMAKAGTVMFAVLDTAVNSDEPGPIMATIVEGQFKGGKLLGSLQPFGPNADRVALNFNKLILPDMPKSMSVNALAVDPNTARTALSSDTDHHYLLRYGSLFASSFLQGYGQAVIQSGSWEIDRSSGTTERKTKELGSKELAAAGLGQVGTTWGSQLGNIFNRPPTVHVYAGTSVGILFQDDVQSIQ